MIDLPLINFLDPNSIRSVGAFYRCVFNFGYNKRQCFQTLYAWAIISVLMGIVLTWLKTSTTKDSGMQNWIIMYSIVVISPCHVLPVFFWIFFYNYYGAYVNQSFMDISELYNEMGNVLDSIRTMLIMESTFGGLKVHIIWLFFLCFIDFRIQKRGRWSTTIQMTTTMLLIKQSMQPWRIQMRSSRRRGNRRRIRSFNKNQILSSTVRNSCRTRINS